MSDEQDMVDVVVEDYGDSPFPCTFIDKWSSSAHVVAFDRDRAERRVGPVVRGGWAMIKTLSDRLLFEELLYVMGGEYDFLVEGGHRIKLR